MESIKIVHTFLFSIIMNLLNFVSRVATYVLNIVKFQQVDHFAGKVYDNKEIIVFLYFLCIYVPHISWNECSQRQF